MPSHGCERALSPADRRRELAGILARGVLRRHRSDQTRGFPPESGPERRNSLEFPGETRLSVSRTRGFRPRDDGDNA